MVCLSHLKMAEQVADASLRSPYGITKRESVFLKAVAERDSQPDQIRTMKGYFLTSL